ncbi:MAG: tripartite tricarboxylate transporter TctB family protein [Alphaproteobacteria bacterium]
MTASDVRVLVTIGLLAAYALLVPMLGFFTTSALFLVCHMLYLGIRAPVWIVGVTVGLLVVAWVVFAWFLSVPLPRGAIY